MKKSFEKVIAVIMAVIIGTLVSVQAFAAASTAEYVSEVKIAYGKTFADAKKWLTDNGYTPVDADLNEKADGLLSTARAVCLGYKTTNNASEAITDLKVMNMKGNYSFEAYEMLLKEQTEQIAIFVSELTAALDEYRTNYADGLYKAVAAHDLLDKILDDDTGKTMGELLLNKTVQEIGDDAYSALSPEEQVKHADMVKILLQGNSQVTQNIEQYLFIASDTSEDTFVDRLEKIGGYDDFETKYSISKGINNGDALEKALAAEFDDTAILLSQGIEAFKVFLADYTESEMFDETDEDKVIDWFDKNGKAGDYLVWTNARSIYSALNSIDYEDGTLYDFFTNEDYDLVSEDRYMLYPLISTLSEGQRACVRYINLNQLFDNGIMDNESWKTNYEQIKTEIIDDSPVVSAYSGVNRELFEGGVALTNAAKSLNDSSENTFTDNFILDTVTAPTYLFLAGFMVTAVATVAFKMAANTIKAKLPSIVSTCMRKVNYIQIEFNPPILTRLTSENVAEMTEDMMSGTFSSKGFCCLDTNKMEAAAEMVKQARMLNMIGNILCIAMLIFSILTVASAYRDMYNYYHTDKTPIPKYMVDESTDENGESTYTYYSAVTCNRIEGKFVDDKNKLLEDYGDLNGDVGKEWLALYATKDSAAGNPIKAEFLCQKGSNKAGSKIPLTMFGDKNALNLVNEKYAYNDEFGGIYLFWSATSASFASSVISSGTIAIIVVAALAVILIPTLIAVKKKKAAKAA